MFLSLYFDYDVVTGLWIEYHPHVPHWITSEMRYDTPRNFDFGHSIHKTRKGALLALECLHRWNNIPRAKLYVQEI